MSQLIMFKKVLPAEYPEANADFSFRRFNGSDEDKQAWVDICKGALIGAAVGCVAYALASVPINYFLIYPMFGQFVVPMPVILGMYQTLNPNVENLWEALTQFNLPFNLFKEVLVSAITFLVYKKLSPILHGKKG